MKRRTVWIWGIGGLLFLGLLVWGTLRWGRSSGGEAIAPIPMGAGNVTVPRGSLREPPPTLGDLPLREVVRGEGALAEIERLHGEEFRLREALVARYGDPRGQAVLWVARTPVSLVAERMVEEMQRGIGAGGTPFTPLAPRAVGAWVLYEALGPGGHHVYWAAGDRVYWLQADEAFFEPALEDLLQALP